MRWCESWRADPRARALADRHYNRRRSSIGSTQFVPPGRCLVLVTAPADAFWITSWPYAEFTRHRWAGAWMNSAFRNENRRNLSSELILEAVAATRHKWPHVPALGMVSFVDPEKVKSKRHPGYCFIMAGFHLVGETESGLLAFQLLPHEMPDAQPADSAQMGLIA